MLLHILVYIYKLLYIYYHILKILLYIYILVYILLLLLLSSLFLLLLYMLLYYGILYYCIIVDAIVYDRTSYVMVGCIILSYCIIRLYDSLVSSRSFYHALVTMIARICSQYIALYFWIRCDDNQSHCSSFSFQYDLLYERIGGTRPPLTAKQEQSVKQKAAVTCNAIPEWTTNCQEIETWCGDGNSCRTTLTQNSYRKQWERHWEQDRASCLLEASKQ